MQIDLIVSRGEVLDEVARMSVYTGAKMDDDVNAYERIGVVDEDKDELLRFWDECRAEIAQSLIRLLVSEGMDADGDTYRVSLRVSDSWDPALLAVMQLGLFTYLTKRITGRWYVYTNKNAVVGYEENAKSALEELKQKAFYKQRPTRPTY